MNASTSLMLMKRCRPEKLKPFKSFTVPHVVPTLTPFRRDEPQMIDLDMSGINAAFLYVFIFGLLVGAVAWLGRALKCLKD